MLREEQLSCGSFSPGPVLASFLSLLSAGRAALQSLSKSTRSLIKILKPTVKESYLLLSKVMCLRFSAAHATLPVPLNERKRTAEDRLAAAGEVPGAGRSLLQLHGR